MKDIVVVQYIWDSIPLTSLVNKLHRIFDVFCLQIDV